MWEILQAVKRELEGLTMFKTASEDECWLSCLFVVVLFILVAAYRDSILALGL